MTNLTVDVLDAEGKKTGSVDLPSEIFDAQANVSLMHQVVVAQLAAKRQGTHKVKGRGEVSGGGAKPYRQKGTGRARQGSIRAPQFTGGGIVHGPVPRDYSQKTPKKMKAAALRGALSDRARAGLVKVVSQFSDGENVKTKDALAILKQTTEFAANLKKRVLVVLDREDLAGWVALRNLPNVHLLVADQLNTYDVLVSDVVVFTEAGLNEFLAGGRSAGTVTVAVDDVAVAEATKAEAAIKPLADVDGVDGDVKDFGPDSHPATDDGEAPEGFDIKGNADSMLYHVPGSAFYNRTVAEVWFRSAEAAEAAGFLLPPSQREEEK